MPNDVKAVANRIYNALQPHERTVRQLESLLFWHRPLRTLGFIACLELLFFSVKLLPFTGPCNFCIISAVLVSLYRIYQLYPTLLDKLISFKKVDLDDDAPNYLRTVVEISAYLTTTIIVIPRFFRLAIVNLLKRSWISCGSIVFFALILLTLTAGIGDFWIIWFIFHGVLFTPGILFLPPVYNWMYAESSRRKSDFRTINITEDVPDTKPKTEEKSGEDTAEEKKNDEE